MPELPDVTIYIEALARHVGGRVLRRVRVASPFVVRSVEPPIAAAEGRAVAGVRRLGKRIVLEMAAGPGEAPDFIIIHLMIAGRLRWKRAGVAIPRRRGLCAFDFDHGSLLFTEASSKKRASIHVARGEAGLAEHDPGGLEVPGCSPADFAAALTAESHTVKRALTDPRILSGVGNAYSDEILHRARLSPFKLTGRLAPEELGRLHAAAQAVLAEWTARLRSQVGDGFPDKVTAFHPEMAVHGKFGEPCPACGTPVQRIRYAESEANYCPTCQTGGRLLADRGLSRLLRKDWPRTLDELERLKRDRRGGA